MKRKGKFTLIELLIVVSILVILGSLIGVGWNGFTGYYNQTQNGKFHCVKTYTVTKGGDSPHTEKRVDLRPLEGGSVETFICADNWRLGVSNSATIYGQFEPGRAYYVRSVGFRREGWYAAFPTVVEVKDIPQ